MDKKFITIDDNKIFYIEKGEGIPIIFLHGITTYSFIWEEILELFPDKYRLIAIDLLGCGDSDKPLDIPYSIKSHSKIIKKFVKQMGIDKFHIVGHDLGGGIAQIFAANYEEMLLSMTLANSVAYDFWSVQPIIAMKTPIIRQLAMATLDLGTFNLIVKKGLYNNEKCTKDLMKKFWYPMKTKEGRKAFLHFAYCLDNSDLLEISENLRNLKIPVLLLRGDCDLYLSESIVLKLESEIPTSNLKRIKTAGHYIQIDEPQLTAEKISNFIRRQNE